MKNFFQKISNSINKLIYDYRSFEIVELKNQSIFHLYEVFDFKDREIIKDFETYESCLQYIEKLYEKSLLKDYKISSNVDIITKQEIFNIYKKLSNKLAYPRSFKSYEEALQGLKKYCLNYYIFKIKKI